jgi:superfamily II DNA helicase RecQ
VYDRLAELIAEHRTTLVFVNTRRLAERVARQLSERIGREHVTAHHGSLAKELRLDAEQRLKRGELKALVATASLELGIDIGDVDLVCQMSSPRSINAFLQRVGRSGHAAARLRGGCFQRRETISSSRLPCSMQSAEPSSIVCTFRRMCWTYCLNRSQQKSLRASGQPMSCTRLSRPHIRTERSPARNSTRSCRCWQTASARAAAGMGR